VVAVNSKRARAAAGALQRKPDVSQTKKRLDAMTLSRYIVSMSTKRATVYFDEALHRALRLKAAETDRSVSDLVNDAVKQSLAEDAEDLAVFDERASEPDLPFEDVVKELRASGKL